MNIFRRNFLKLLPLSVPGFLLFGKNKEAHAKKSPDRLLPWEGEVDEIALTNDRTFVKYTNGRLIEVIERGDIYNAC